MYYTKNPYVKKMWKTPYFPCKSIYSMQSYFNTVKSVILYF